MRGKGLGFVVFVRERRVNIYVWVKRPKSPYLFCAVFYDGDLFLFNVDILGMTERETLTVM